MQISRPRRGCNLGRAFQSTGVCWLKSDPPILSCRLEFKGTISCSTDRPGGCSGVPRLPAMVLLGLKPPCAATSQHNVGKRHSQDFIMASVDRSISSLLQCCWNLYARLLTRSWSVGHCISAQMRQTPEYAAKFQRDGGGGVPGEGSCLGEALPSSSLLSSKRWKLTCRYHSSRQLRDRKGSRTPCRRQAKGWLKWKGLKVKSSQV